MDFPWNLENLVGFPSRALDSCHRQEGSWALGTRMVTSRDLTIAVRLVLQSTMSSIVKAVFGIYRTCRRGEEKPIERYKARISVTEDSTKQQSWTKVLTHLSKTNAFYWRPSVISGSIFFVDSRHPLSPFSMLQYAPWTLWPGYNTEKGRGGRNVKIRHWKLTRLTKQVFFGKCLNYFCPCQLSYCRYLGIDNLKKHVADFLGLVVLPCSSD